MRLRRRTLTAFAVAVAALAVGVGTAGADAATGGGNDVVLAQSVTDGSWLARASTQVLTYSGPALTSANLADATASGCTSCYASAVAVQVIFVTSNPTYFAPANAAVATTAGCTDCGAYAYSWQYVIETNGPVHLSAGTEADIASLRQQIAATAASITPSDAVNDPSLANDHQLDAQLDGLTAELKSVIDDNLQSAGTPASGVVFRHVQSAPGA